MVRFYSSFPFWGTLPAGCLSHSSCATFIAGACGRHPASILPEKRMYVIRASRRYHLRLWMMSGVIHSFFRVVPVVSMGRVVVPYDGARSFLTIRHSVRLQGLCAFSLLPVVVGCWYLSSSDGFHDHCGSLLVEEPLAHVVHVGSHVGEIFPVSVAEIV